MGFVDVNLGVLWSRDRLGDRVGCARTIAMFALLLLADVASPSPSSSGTLVWVFIVVAVVVIAIGLGILWVLRSRRAERREIAAAESTSAAPHQAEDPRD